jgi:hypothetical protein
MEYFTTVRYIIVLGGPGIVELAKFILGYINRNEETHEKIKYKLNYDKLIKRPPILSDVCDAQFNIILPDDVFNTEKKYDDFVACLKKESYNVETFSDVFCLDFSTEKKIFRIDKNDMFESKYTEITRSTGPDRYINKDDRIIYLCGSNKEFDEGIGSVSECSFVTSFHYTKKNQLEIRDSLDEDYGDFDRITFVEKTDEKMFDDFLLEIGITNVKKISVTVEQATSSIDATSA